jgi:glycosyltransferase involved in cell wall biosynthesis
VKFAVYQPWIYLHGGLERSILELVTASRHDWVIYTSYHEPDGTFPEFKQLDVRVVGKTTVQRNLWGVLKSAVNIARLKLPLEDDVDALVVWCDGLGDLVTFRNAHLPLMNICSTPLRAVYDPVYEATLTGDLGIPAKILYAIFKYGFRFVDRIAWRRFTGIVTTSGEVKQRILAGGLAQDEQRMVMAYPGITWHETPPNQAFEPFILVPGRMMWTKNIQLAIRAFLLALPPEPWRLVIAGYVDQKSKTYLAELRELAGSSARIEFVVNPTDQALRELYERASFCLFTPLNEDWGIVPLEAMAHGKAVIANARGGPLESIVHEHTGFLLEPDAALWNAMLQRLTREPETVRRLGRQAHEHVRKFTWKEFAHGVDNALEAWASIGTTSLSTDPEDEAAATSSESN